MGPQPEGTATTAGISAGEIMTTPVITVAADTPAGEIAETLTRYRVSAVPVVDASGAVLGLVSEYDLLAKVGSRARDVMVTAVISVSTDTSIADVRHLLVERRIRRVPAPGDGARVLVDRIWPRGLTKEKAHLDEWCKPVAPSTALRKWYGHDPARFEEFARRYRAELEEPERAEAVEHLRELARHRPLTLLTATKHADISEAVVLADLLRGWSDR